MNLEDGMDSEDVMDWEDVMVPNYGTPRITLSRGEGIHVWDDAGRRYTDLIAGIAVNVLGHAHPDLVAAVRSQIGTLGHTSNLYGHEPGLRLAARLSALVGGHKVLFTNSGTEANEAALKTVRRWAHDAGRDDAVVVALHSGFHGRTLGSLALTGQPKHQEGFGPLPGGIVHAAPTAEGLAAALDGHDVVAVFYEAIQGEGGVRPLPEAATAVLRDAQQNGVLLVADEVQTGVGRTGTFLASQWLDLRPDVVTLAKGLGGGLPLGACLVRPDVAAHMGPGTHGCTFGGNPVATAAANVVLDALEADDGVLQKEVVRLGVLLAAAFDEAGLTAHGKGLLWGVDAPGRAGDVVRQMEDAGFLVGQAGPDVVRLAPPLIVDEAELRDAVAALAAAILPADATD